jgi:hypothetical protein
VRNVLAPEVEGRWGYRLCLHYHDFHPGKQILDNIERCLNNSRRMMFIFSPFFAHSRWCRFELCLGLHQAMYHNEHLLVVYLSHVAAEDLTAGMTAILRSNTVCGGRSEVGMPLSSGAVCGRLYLMQGQAQMLLISPYVGPSTWITAITSTTCSYRTLKRMGTG